MFAWLCGLPSQEWRVDHSRDDLVKLRVVEGGDDVATGSRRGEDNAMHRNVLDPSCDLGYRLFPATLGTSKLSCGLSPSLKILD
ncbi:hypothetical protein V6N13_067199 [Hibiscus sabdariffa]